MQTITLDDGQRLAYKFEGAEDGPVILLSAALGTTHALFDDQMPALLETHGVLRYDMRGHGASEIAPGPYSIERLGKDVLCLLDALELKSVAFCGISIGGMIGMWLALHAPERLNALILANTAARTANPAVYDERIAKVRDLGIDAIADAVMANWFTPGFKEREPDAVARIDAMLRACDPEGYVATCAAVRDMDLLAALPNIATTTAVIVGTHDKGTPPEAGRAIAEAIQGAYLIELEAAHLANIEQREGFDVALAAFIQAQPATG
ncbi:3-oxoadipate enol-lactonase [Arboricoccus pini]|uniref:3-oxoadipate enol-lactonase n=1 Tax=Arboricoccus pini TaxID=1963835 RepID=A0A212RZ75_9PROT|nr:3-oxoadipate enol-lactonase [Arboricoccus pini]SNB78168.1 3-oxoadipate enol-lactonase [Arboricoccus pini]